MTVFTNIDQVPAGRCLFTLHVTLDPEGTPRSQMACEEEDAVAPSGATWGQVVNDGEVVGHRESNVGAVLRAVYGLDMRVIGVVDQSCGYVLYDAFKAGDETGEDDL